MIKNTVKSNLLPLILKPLTNDKGNALRTIHDGLGEFDDIQVNAILILIGEELRPLLEEDSIQESDHIMIVAEIEFLIIAVNQEAK